MASRHSFTAFGFQCLPILYLPNLPIKLRKWRSEYWIYLNNIKELIKIKGVTLMCVSYYQNVQHISKPYNE